MEKSEKQELAEINKEYEDLIFKMQKSIEEASAHREMNLRSAHILLDRIFHYLINNSRDGETKHINKDLQNLALNRRLDEDMQRNMTMVRTYLLELRSILKEIR